MFVSSTKYLNVSGIWIYQETLKESVNDTDSRKAKLAGTLAAASKVRTLAKDLSGGNLGSIRVQAAIGSQSTKSQTTSHQETNDAANLLAQNNLIVNLKGKGADSDLTVTGSNLTVGNNFYQSVEGDVLYQASTQTDTQDSQNSSKGWGVGVYASTQIGSGQSNQGFTVNANKAKGGSHETTTTHTNTQVTVGGTTVNDIGGNLILDGANLNTKHLTGTVGGDLIVKSRQDGYQYTHDQKQAGFSADVGFDGKPQSFSINGGKTDADADYAQVTHQSGIKAQESTLSVQGQGKFTSGYLITDAGKNQTQFAQGIQTQDIQNHLNYEGDAISVGIGIGADTSNPNGKAKPALQGIGYGKIDPVHKTSTTHSVITDQAGLSHINTESFKQEEVQNQLNEIITNDFNKEQVLTELGAQVNITTEFDNERRAVRSEYAKKAEGYRKQAEELPQGSQERTELETKAKQIDDNLRLFDGITSALYAPNSNGIIGDVARAASPELAYRIGQYFKDNKTLNQLDNGNRPEEQSANHLLAHAILGAAVSYATGNNPTTVTTAYTATDGSTADAVSAAEVGKVGVENNANAKEVMFAAQHPWIASQIGTVMPSADLHTVQNPNISTVVATFQINLLNNNGGDYDAISGEGSISNAYRHTLWQAIIANKFGSDIAIKVGNAHENTYTHQDIEKPTYGGVYLDKLFYSSLSSADEVADQFNNKIGRELAAKSPKLSNKEYAQKVLVYHYNYGLYQVKKIDGSYLVVKTRLPAELYNRAVTTLRGLDNTGAGPVLQQKREDYFNKTVIEGID
ncbi:hemagglutinin repeat-containing protein [Moraxella porci]|uniref:hemagglutinin repeat-containing protein n=1 Tax=Moraxella porci TaxID=1288392 RepID=UPI0009945FB8|nr:hemagglutinin repeat-containing protein [Moraxella porci]